MAGDSLTGKTVLITGGARGIGLETARQLVERGANVALVDLREDEVRAAAASFGEHAAAFTADVRDPDALDAAVTAAAQRFGGIDVVVANAGIAEMATLTGDNVEVFERTIQVNLMGPWHTVRVALPHLRRSGGYALVVASVASVLHAPFHGAYAASKAGVEALANVLRTELDGEGVDIGVAYFPYIDTPMVQDAFSTTMGAALWDRLSYPLNRRIPVAKAGRAMVRGIDRRARRVYTPRWVRTALIARAALPRVVESQMRRARVQDLVRDHDAAQQPEAANTPVSAVTQA